MQVIMKGKLIPVFVLAALVSCSQPPVKEQGPRPVKLADVTSLNMVEKSFSGVVSPDQFSDLAFKMSGPLISLNVDEGQKVRTGQIVAEIDPLDFKWEYEAKKASFQTAEAQLQRAKKVKQAVTGYGKAVKKHPSKSMSLRKPLTQMPRRLSSMRKIH